MKKNFHLQLFVLAVVFLQASVLFAQELVHAAPESAGCSAERLARLTATLENYVNQEKLPGTVTLIARGGKIIYFDATGSRDIERGIPMEKNSIFRIASQTKALVSVGVMMLQEEGKLLISDPVGKYIAAFNTTTVAVPGEDGSYTIEDANRPITIRDLLTHTSGIGYGQGIAADLWEKAGIQGWYFADREEPILETVTRMASLPFDAQPGDQFVYGYNTDILGAIIEIVSGEPLDEFLKHHIFDPLGMHDTFFYLPEEKNDRLTVVYSAAKDGLERAPDPGGMVGQGHYAKGPRTSFSGGAGCLSTAMDYSTFLQMLLNKGTYNGKRILSPKSVELMTVNHIGSDKFPWEAGTGFGLGFSILEDLGARGRLGTEGSFGWGGAYHSSYWVDPAEELVVVYFTQLIPASGLDDHDKVRTLIYQALTE
ncbi:MAG: serine hydrolase domain-containing protein [Bacteroidales bacterium]